MDLTVVIPARNVAVTIREQLDALVQQEWDRDWEIVVVDNGSTDETASIIEEFAAQHPRVRYVLADDGAGVNFVRNRGFEVANADHIALCDGDDIVGPNWVAAMGEALQHDRVVAGPLEVDRLNPRWLVATRGSYPLDRPRTYSEAFVLVPGGNFGMRRDAWAAIGGFREDVFGATEDVEFSLRLHLAGIRVGFAPTAILHYRYRTEAAVLFRQGRFYGRGKPLICRLAHEHGLPTPSRVAGWKSWLLLGLWLPRLRSAEGRAAYCWILGSRLGQLEGIIHHRALWL
jgi:glycosyltransferase involved in cell wall biosynthesis